MTCGDRDSGDVIGLSAVVARVGSSTYLNGRFAISGQNIRSVRIETDKCNLYSAISIYEGDSEYKKAQSAIARCEGEEYVMITDTDFDYDEDMATRPRPHHYEHLVVEGNFYEGDYDDKMAFGMSIPKELQSKNDDEPYTYGYLMERID